jgi:hypothetical protein
MILVVLINTTSFLFSSQRISRWCRLMRTTLYRSGLPLINRSMLLEQSEIKLMEI